MFRKFIYMTLLFSLSMLDVGDTRSSDYETLAKQSLKHADKNRIEISKALHLVPRKQQEGMEFLVAFMPIGDLQSLSAEFLLQHVEYAYKAWREATWGESITKDIFLNNILPYSNITETRESWRKDFYERFSAIVKDSSTPGEAAVWHFTGACEPAGEDLDRGWFLGRAAQADRNSRLHAIYAVSYRPTKQRFPVGWAPEKDWVWAVNVTDRYTQMKEELPTGIGRVLLGAVDSNGIRVSADIEVRDANGELVFEGTTNDIRFDTNDHLNVKVKLSERYQILARYASDTIRRTVNFKKAGFLTLFEFQIEK